MCLARDWHICTSIVWENAFPDIPRSGANMSCLRFMDEETFSGSD